MAIRNISDPTTKPPWGTPFNTQSYFGQSVIAAYMLGEGDGTTIHDGVSRWDATWSGLLWKPGYRGVASSFDGSGKINTGITIPTAPGSIVVDFTPTAAGLVAGGRIVGAGDSSVGNHGVELDTNLAGVLGIFAVFRNGGSSGDVNPGVFLTGGTRYTAALTWGPAGCKLYLNGKLLGTNTTISSVSTGGLTLQIGGPGSGSSNNYQGIIERYILFNRQLGAGEIADDFMCPYEAWLPSTETWYSMPTSASSVRRSDMFMVF